MRQLTFFHIVKKSTFIDGNMRVGAVVALVFLTLIGYDFTTPQEKFADFILYEMRHLGTNAGFD